MSAWIHDLRHGLRSIVLHPGFSAVVVLTLAAGIGLSTAVFSLVEQILLRPLPFPEPQRLVVVWERWPAQGLDRMWASPPNFIDWRREGGDVFQDLAARQDRDFNLTGGGEPERVKGSAVSGSFFSLLEIPALLGRPIQPQEERGGGKVVVLGHDLWRRRFGGDREVIGRTIQIDDQSFAIVGVMPASFRFPSHAELWVPLSKEFWEAPREAHFLDVLGRLKPGITLEQARERMAIIATELSRQYPGSNNGWGISVVPLHRELVGEVRPALLLLLGAVLLVLLIACANAANLKLARATTRESEIAVRIALGASRFQLFRQLLLENILLAFVAGVAGLVLAILALLALRELSPLALPLQANTALDFRLLGITILISLVTGLIFGLLPAIKGSRLNFQALRLGRAGGTAKSTRRLRNALVVSEIALALMLLISASLLIRSFSRLTAVDPGFESKNVLLVRVSLSPQRYTEDHQIIDFFSRLVEQLENIPGVSSVGMTTAVPLSDEAGGTSFEPEGLTASAGEKLLANYISVGPGYFESLGVPLVDGRSFDSRDRRDSRPVVIINKAMADKIWQGRRAVGERIKINLDREDWYEIVGVIRNIREEGLDVEQRPAMYLPSAQMPSRSMVLALRAQADPTALASVVRREVWAIDREQPVFGIQTLEEHVSQVLARQRFSMTLVTFFAGLALLLAALGIYSIIAYTVARRSHEIGIRMALGARPAEVTKLIVGQGLLLAALGVLAGLVASFLLSRLMSGLLFGVSATDLVTYVLIPLILLFVAVFAAYLPASRAARISPVIALKRE
jgi:putative ABC transport system permease protein